jgi:hypothetical protein
MTTAQINAATNQFTVNGNNTFADINLASSGYLVHSTHGLGYVTDVIGNAAAQAGLTAATVYPNGWTTYQTPSPAVAGNISAYFKQALPQDSGGNFAFDSMQTMYGHVFPPSTGNALGGPGTPYGMAAAMQAWSQALPGQWPYFLAGWSGDTPNNPGALGSWPIQTWPGVLFPSTNYFSAYQASSSLPSNEVRDCILHNGAEYCGVSQWGQVVSKPPYGFIMYQTTPGGPWTEDNGGSDFGQPNLAIVRLLPHTFKNTAPATSPGAFASPVEIAFAGAWNIGASGTSDAKVQIWTRNDTLNAGCTGAIGIWCPFTIQSAVTNAPGQAAQVRGFAAYTDSVTGLDMVFAATEPNGIFGCWLTNGSTGASYRIACESTPELNAQPVAPVVTASAAITSGETSIGLTAACPAYPSGTVYAYDQNNGFAQTNLGVVTCTGSTLHISAGAAFAGTTAADNIMLSPWTNYWSMNNRPMALTACPNAAGQNALYTVLGPAVYKRTDGLSPTWAQIAYVPASAPFQNNDGLRGLTCIHNQSAAGGKLLVVMEGGSSTGAQHPGIYSIDINQTPPIAPVLDLDLAAFLDTQLDPLGTRGGSGAGYVIAGYNYGVPASGASPFATPLYGSILFGLTIEWNGANAPSNPLVSVYTGLSTGEPVISQASYLIRNANGTYQLFILPPNSANPQYATRVVAPSLVAGQFLFCGVDSYQATMSNFGWCTQGSVPYDRRRRRTRVLRVQRRARAPVRGSCPTTASRVRARGCFGSARKCA